VAEQVDDLDEVVLRQSSEGIGQLRHGHLDVEVEVEDVVVVDVVLANAEERMT